TGDSARAGLCVFVCRPRRAGGWSVCSTADAESVVRLDANLCLESAYFCCLRDLAAECRALAAVRGNTSGCSSGSTELALPANCAVVSGGAPASQREGCVWSSLTTRVVATCRF